MTDENNLPLDRYAKQARFAPLGADGQQRLMRGRVLVVGCGALGSVLAESLARAGVGSTDEGFLRLVDRDFLERSNLHRQTLYNERQCDEGLPKAVAAAQRLAEINSSVRVEPIVADCTWRNVAELAAGVDLVLDGTDNFETRLLVNDLAVRDSLPWVYAGVVGAEGRVMPILPGEGACFACLAPAPPAPGEAPTCDSAGVLGAAVGAVASIQALEALKLLAGATDAVAHGLTVVDLWGGRYRRLEMPPDADCRCCARRQFDWLDGKLGGQAAILCGRGAVQLSPAAGATKVDLPALRAKLAPLGPTSANPFLVRVQLPAADGGHELTIFADGRAIITGVETEAAARTIWNRTVGG